MPQLQDSDTVGVLPEQRSAGRRREAEGDRPEPAGAAGAEGARADAKGTGNGMMLDHAPHAEPLQKKPLQEKASGLRVVIEQVRAGARGAGSPEKEKAT